MKDDNFFVKLVKSRTGYNSKTFVMLVGVAITFIMQLSIIPLFYLAALGGVVVNWYGISLVITAISTFAGVVIWGKVKTDSMEYKYGDAEMNNNQDNSVG